MIKYEFCLTAKQQDNPWKEETQVVSKWAKDEHTARRSIIKHCLRAGLWVCLLISVEDLTG